MRPDKAFYQTYPSFSSSQQSATIKKMIASLSSENDFKKNELLEILIDLEMKNNEEAPFRGKNTLVADIIIELIKNSKINHSSNTLFNHELYSTVDIQLKGFHSHQFLNWKKCKNKTNSYKNAKKKLKSNQLQFTPTINGELSKTLAISIQIILDQITNLIHIIPATKNLINQVGKTLTKKNSQERFSILSYLLISRILVDLITSIARLTINKNPGKYKNSDTIELSIYKNNLVIALTFLSTNTGKSLQEGSASIIQYCINDPHIFSSVLTWKNMINQSVGIQDGLSVDGDIINAQQFEKYIATLQEELMEDLEPYKQNLELGIQHTKKTEKSPEIHLSTLKSLTSILDSKLLNAIKQKNNNQEKQFRLFSMKARILYKMFEKLQAKKRQNNKTTLFTTNQYNTNTTIPESETYSGKEKRSQSSTGIHTTEKQQTSSLHTTPPNETALPNIKP